MSVSFFILFFIIFFQGIDDKFDKIMMIIKSLLPPVLLDKIST